MTYSTGDNLTETSLHKNLKDYIQPHSERQPVLPDRGDATIQSPKGHVIQLGKGPREHALGPQPAHDALDARDDVTHRAHRRDRRRAAQRRVDGVQAVVDARGQRREVRAHAAEPLHLRVEALRVLLELRDLGGEGLAAALLGRERGVLRVELLAEGGELVLGMTHGAPLGVDGVLHRAEVDGCEPDGDDRGEEQRRRSLSLSTTRCERRFQDSVVKGRFTPMRTALCSRLRLPKRPSASDKDC